MSAAKQTTQKQGQPGTRKDVPAIIRQYPAPHPGYKGAQISLEALSTYCKFYGYRVVRLIGGGDEILIEPIPAEE